MNSNSKLKNQWIDEYHQGVRYGLKGRVILEEKSPQNFFDKYIVLFLIFSIIAIPFSALFSWLLWMPLTSLVSIGMLGLLSVLLYNNNRTKYLLVCKFIPYTMFFMMFYSWVSVLAILGVKTNWKGQRLSRKI